VRLLDRYLLRELLVPLAYCLGGFLIFYISFDLIFQINQFQEKHLLFHEVVEYYVVTLPEIMADQVIPISLLLAALYALTNHSRHNELTAIRAAGVSLWRLALPYLAVGIVCGAVIFTLNEFWVPNAAEVSKEIMDRHIHDSDPNKAAQIWNRHWTGRLEFHHDADQRHWMMSHYNRSTSEMITPHVTWETPDGASHWLSAGSAIFTNGQWRFYNAERWDRAADGFGRQTTNAFIDVPFSETPASIRAEIKVASISATEAAKEGGKGPRLSIRELSSYLHWHPHLDRKNRWPIIMTQLQARLAAPFTCVAVILIALPFGARSGRHNVFIGVAGSIFICFAYFIIQRISVGLGIAGYIHPILAAWLPNILFGGAGIFLTSRVR
jgi:lipopolysaccharide export system permease protein